MNGAARRILRYLDAAGPRSATILRGAVVRPGAPRSAGADFERGIGQLFLRGFIVARGRTNARVIGLNGRRRAA